MKKIILFLLIAAPLFTFAQTGFGIYPFTNIVSIRWNPQTVIRDSSNKASFVTDYKIGLELRTALTLKHSSRGINVTASPELALYHKVYGEIGEPMLLTGFGISTAINHGGLTSGGVFVPFEMYYRPKTQQFSHVFISCEADAFLAITSSRQTFNFRPLISCGWIF